jgi:ankyrin repeat protein
MIQSNVEWRTPPPNSFLIFILHLNNDHIITYTDRQKQIMWNIIKVSKGGYNRIKFISELRNKQVNLDLFRKNWIKKIQFTDYLIEAGYEVNQRNMVKDESPT